MAAPSPIPALMPRGDGHHFVLYADCCSGIPGTTQAATFAAVNAALARLEPKPEFILFPGDEVLGLTTDEAALRAQWRHWLDVEMAWLDRQAIPLYHTTANHTVYDAMSARVFAGMLDHLPRNGPPGREGRSYFVRRGDLLMVFVDTVDQGLGGEGHVETEWLEATLRAQSDARYKLVIGHHPVFPANGFTGPYQRQIGPEYAEPFWQQLVEHGVTAYLCSHMLAFDVQVHEGVLQIMSAGAGTLGLMPEDTEYHHFVQVALDAQGLRYQVIDPAGQVREALSWPPDLPPADGWRNSAAGLSANPIAGQSALLACRFSGTAAAMPGPAQTLVSAEAEGPGLPPIWIGLTGCEQKLTVILRPSPSNSPHAWSGPGLSAGQPFDIQLALHPDMGPGGLLWRAADDAPWSSLLGASPWGTERLTWSSRWSTGQGSTGPADQPFLGSGLQTAIARLPAP